MNTKLSLHTLSVRRIVGILTVAALLSAYPAARTAAADSVIPTPDSVISTPDSVISTAGTPAVRHKRNTIFRRIGDAFTKVFKDFNAIDTNYIVPQRYNYTVMLQNTNTYEMYELKSKSGQSVLFAPQPAVKLGPYIGWRWVFLGYTFDINHISNNKNKKEIDLSLYSSLFGIDLYYRRTGNDYRIREATLGEGMDRKVLNGVPFSGLEVYIKGFDLYYIFNHRKFSYPAAFSQSTCQRRSCGSPLFGIGYMRHEINLDHEELEKVVSRHLPAGYEEVKLDSGLMFNQVRYRSFSVSAGYAYNWAFARNCLFAVSLSAAMAYKKTDGDVIDRSENLFLRDFNFKNLNVDGIGRFGFIWNNTKWFAGVNTILHSYSYRKSQFSTNNMFGSVNVFVGFNFGRKK